MRTIFIQDWIYAHQSFDQLDSSQQQLLIGIEGQLNAFQDKLQVKGEWVRSLDLSRENAFADAWSIQSQARFFNGKTSLRGSYENLSPAYFSIGAPLLIRGSRRYSLEAQQSFFKKYTANSLICEAKFQSLIAI